MNNEGKKTLYGGTSTNVAAFCRLHRCYMTVKQIREHDCLAKQCWHLDKVDHPWWRHRENIKKKRQERKELIYGGKV